jgi:hypothetical protein
VVGRAGYRSCYQHGKMGVDKRKDAYRRGGQELHVQQALYIPPSLPPSLPASARVYAQLLCLRFEDVEGINVTLLNPYRSEGVGGGGLREGGREENTEVAMIRHVFWTKAGERKERRESEGGREEGREGGKEGRGRTCLREEILLKFCLLVRLIFALFGPILLSLPPAFPPALPPALSGSNPATGAAPA